MKNPFIALNFIALKENTEEGGKAESIEKENLFPPSFLPFAAP